MSVARNIFCERIATIRGAISTFNLRDLPAIPANLLHNNSARIIRNGLAVQCFNIFEDFVKARTEEILVAISSSGVQFTHLPVAFQKAATVGTIKAIEFQLKLRDKANQISYVQDYSGKIHSTTLSALILSEICFFHAAPNISKDHFRDAMIALSVARPWAQIAGLCSRLGISGIPAEVVFDSLAQRRHRAAHNANASISETDLTQSLVDATGLAMCFDILVSKVSVLISNLSSVIPTNIDLITDQSSIPLRVIKHDGSRFYERKLGGARNTRCHSDLSALRDNAMNRATRENGVLVIFDRSEIPTEWRI